MTDNAAYYDRREQAERMLAAQSADQNVRDIHLMMAEAYAQLARDERARIDIAQLTGDASRPPTGTGSRRAAAR